MDSGINTVITKRRRPNKTTTCAKIAQVPFKDQAKKNFPCLALTYFYNIEMNQFNKEDQIRANYLIK